MRPLHLPLLLALPVLLAACGSGNPKDEGLDALQKGKWSDAVASLDQALAKTDPAAPDYMEIAMGRCKALAHVDPVKAQAEFEKLAASRTIQPAEYRAVVAELLATKAYPPAIELMDKGLKQFPGDPTMAQLRDEVVEKSKKAASPEANKSLESLGYVGGEDD